ncbi:MAG: hypothetical protein WKG01_41780 [Kofleriaceae bacterium]
MLCEDLGGALGDFVVTAGEQDQLRRDPARTELGEPLERDLAYATVAITEAIGQRRFDALVTFPNRRQHHRCSHPQLDALGVEEIDDSTTQVLAMTRKVPTTIRRCKGRAPSPRRRRRRAQRRHRGAPRQAAAASIRGDHPDLREQLRIPRSRGRHGATAAVLAGALEVGGAFGTLTGGGAPSGCSAESFAIAAPRREIAGVGSTLRRERGRRTARHATGVLESVRASSTS